MSSKELKVFLDTKPLYYKEIDHLRVLHAYRRLKAHIHRPQTIHIVGTNGKGSTGRIVAYLAYRQGLRSEELRNSKYSVGHYSSPHILKFNERIWLDGVDASDEVLEVAHQRLFGILGQEIAEALSYFEYTTLLAFVVFEDCDLMVLEAGLGGEFDATNVCDKELSIITPIGLDHQAFLGDTIKQIATTKIRSIQNRALLAPQVYDEVIEIAKMISEEKGAKLFLNEKLESKNEKLRSIIQTKGWADYLMQNTSVAMQALDILEIDYDISDLIDLELFGRFYPLSHNIRIDVGHNPLAARAIEKALDTKVVLIYNALDDKDYEEVLHILKPKIKHVEIIQIDSQRAVMLEKIQRAIRSAGLEYREFKHKINENENYLVFGSFYVVEAFLKQRKESNVSK